MKVRSISNPFKSKLGEQLLNFILIICGSLIYAVAVNMFTVPNGIVAGGFTGIATMLNFCFGLPVGVCVLVMNVPMFIWGAAENGTAFLTKTVFATVCVSAFIDFSKPFITAYGNDVLLASLFGGILSGIGFALILYAGGTTGGTDIFAKNMHRRFPHISIGRFVFGADMLVIILAGFVYKNIESMLYPVVFIFASVKVMDSVMYGFAHNNGKLIFIISEKYDSIRDEILSKISRGLTLLNSEGGYAKTEKKVIMCAVRSSQVHKVNRLALDIDNSAFIIITTADAISGKGFAEEN